jgi:ElaB/YqjD/DUF883 family membrane-anchored ribosome-binding protein
MIDERRSDGSFIDQGRDVPESMAAAKQEIAATRARMSGTITEIEQRVSGTFERAREKVDVIELVKQHPWPALAAAFVAGVALSATGADRRAAGVTTRVARRAPETAKRGVGQAIEATKARVSNLAEHVKGTSDESTSGGSGAESSSGLAARATNALRAQVRELGSEVQRGADELSELSRPT